MKNKFSAIILTALLALSLTACGGKDSSSSAPAGADNKTEAATDSGDKETNADTPNDDSGDDKPAQTEASTDDKPDGRQLDFSVKFGNVEITEIPFDVSILEADGWAVEYAGDGEMSYATKDGNYISLEFEDCSKETVKTIFIENDANMDNSVFDISDITLFGTYKLADLTEASQLKDFIGADDEIQIDNGYCFYHIIFKSFKGCPSVSIGRRYSSETDFVISMSGESDTTGGSSDDGSDDGNQDDGTHDWTEQRIYKIAPDDLGVSRELYIYAWIGNEGVTFELNCPVDGNSMIYAHCSYEQMGEFVAVLDYRLSSADGGMPEYAGKAKFEMTEEKLIVTRIIPGATGESVQEYDRYY